MLYPEDRISGHVHLTCGERHYISGANEPAPVNELIILTSKMIAAHNLDPARPKNWLYTNRI